MIFHIYIDDDEARTIQEAAAQHHQSIAAVFRGALKAMTNNLQDFTGLSGPQSWADFRARGRPSRPFVSTGNELADETQQMIKREMGGPVNSLLQRIEEIQAQHRGMSVSEALEVALAQASEPTEKSGPTDEGDPVIARWEAVPSARAEAEVADEKAWAEIDAEYEEPVSQVAARNQRG